MATTRYRRGRGSRIVGNTSVVFWIASMLWGLCFLGLLHWLDHKDSTGHAHAILMFFGWTGLSAVGGIYAVAGLFLDRARKWIAGIGLVLNLVAFLVVMTCLFAA